MIRDSKHAFLVLSFLVFTTSFQGRAQTQEVIPHYINLNQTAEGALHEISDQRLNIEYNDAYGVAKEMLLKIYDWKQSAVATCRLDKSYGLNNYTVDLGKVYSGWEINKTYTAEVKNESGMLYRLPFRIVSPPDTNGPDVSVMVNPLTIDCKDLSGNLVEFYGVINGGKAPYAVSWFVLNNSRTDFLYQPKEAVVELPGKTSLITVDKNPEYYVVLYVKDACGNEQKRIVNMVCDNDKKKINTIFVEELPGTFNKINPIK